MSNIQNENMDETPLRLSSITGNDFTIPSTAVHSLRALYNRSVSDFDMERAIGTTLNQNIFSMGSSTLKNSTLHINFSEALKLLKEGKKVSNNSWEPKSYLFLCDTVSIDTLPSTELINKKQFIWFSSETNQYDLWKSNSEDLLSEQWFEYTDN